MPADLPEIINVIVASPRPVNLDQIHAVAPNRLNVIDGLADLYPEIEKDWQPRVIEQLIGTPPTPKMNEAEREELIANAHVMPLDDGCFCACMKHSARSCCRGSSPSRGRMLASRPLRIQWHVSLVAIRRLDDATGRSVRIGLDILVASRQHARGRS